ncbi:hypothetical protein STPH1_4878 [Streptomyces sp. OM5714]|nr:hypothetical protein STPH1_4878 [Streptomyces sp. OM5714]
MFDFCEERNQKTTSCHDFLLLASDNRGLRPAPSPAQGEDKGCARSFIFSEQIDTRIVRPSTFRDGITITEDERAASVVASIQNYYPRSILCEEVVMLRHLEQCSCDRHNLTATVIHTVGRNAIRHRLDYRDQFDSRTDFSGFTRCEQLIITDPPMLVPPPTRRQSIFPRAKGKWSSSQSNSSGALVLVNASINCARGDSEAPSRSYQWH